MADTKYNGWTNYATWRVNLEMIDGSDWDCQIDNTTDVYDLSEQLKDWAHEYIDENSLPGVARDYALAFLSDVNWYEIAKNLIEDYAEE